MKSTGKKGLFSRLSGLASWSTANSLQKNREKYLDRLKRTSVRSVELGCFGIKLFGPDAIDREQQGYSGRTWRKSWLVIGHDTGTGDPFITDLANSKLPVFTDTHGKGAWSPRPVSSSLEKFEKAMTILARFCDGRENPVKLEQKPIARAELQRFTREMSAAIAPEEAGFWTTFVENSADIDK